MDIPEDYSLHGQHCTTGILEGVQFFEGIGPLENTTINSVPKLHAPALNVFLNFEGLPRHSHVYWNVIKAANVIELFSSTFLHLYKHCLRICMHQMMTTSHVVIIYCTATSEVGNHSTTIQSSGNYFYRHTPAYQRALARNVESFSSLIGCSGNRLASRDGPEEFIHFNHFTL